MDVIDCQDGNIRNHGIEVCLSNPKAVICMGSALYYQKAVVAESEYLSIATERTDRSMLKMNFSTRRHYFSDSNFQIGKRKQDKKSKHIPICDCRYIC